MNKTLQSLVLSLFSASAVFGAVDSARTFIAHRDELANRGMEWITSSHLGHKVCATSCDNSKDKTGKNQCKSESCAGASLSITPFYQQSTNSADLALLFGQASDTTSEIKVYTGLPTADTYRKWLFGVNIHQSPNSDGTSTGYNPMSGTLSFTPRRQVYGAHIGWNQSLDSLLKGLSLNVRAPFVQVRNSMRATSTGVASDIPSVDGQSGKTIADYFAGNLSTNIATYSHVSQSALAKGKINGLFQTSTGVGDVEARLDWQCCSWKKVSFGLGAGIQIPTGNKPNNEFAFEPIYGARGHVGAGMNGFMHFDAYQNKDLKVTFDMILDWKYFFKGTESRLMGIYDINNKAMVVNSQYRNVMRNGYSGVQPAANVLVADHDVTPGHQLDGVFGMSMAWKNFTFDLGYELFWHQKEKLSFKGSWKNDTYAFAHHHYDMLADAFGTWVVGGGSYLDGDEVVNEKGGLWGDNVGVGDNYGDATSAVGKSGNLIGSNREGWGDPLIVSYDNLDDNSYAPGQFTSIGGPIQGSGSTSTLAKQDYDTETGVTADATGDDAGTQSVNYNISSDVAVTNMQITHSVLGGMSYKIKGSCPMIVGVGAKGEFQESSRNSALEGWSVWAKFGISF